MHKSVLMGALLGTVFACGTAFAQQPAPDATGRPEVSGWVFQTVAPVSLSKATMDAPFPPTFSSTFLPSINGEQETPKRRFFASNFVRASTCQICFPSAASQQVSMPVMP